MDTQHGTWGVRTRVHENPYELHTILYLKKEKRCSWHKHDHSYNTFYVISGELTVKTDIGPEHQYTTITQGQSFTVRPGVFHEFRTGNADTTIYEVAFVKYDNGDIHREELGGDIGNDT
jgi:mannose-6-phosphate isomerase-like protein (cupin superfamily)